MNYPSFYDKVDPIVTYDPLADVLGAIEGGEVVYRYLDMVKLAGHSCPTVAGAWLMAKIGLQKLYDDGVPVRGQIKVEIQEALDSGVAGVIGACLSLVTGAANEGGFKGLNGKFARNDRLFFGVELGAAVRFTRLDNAAHVTMDYNPSIVPPHPDMQPLMQKLMQGHVTPEEKRRFGELWQERVERILLSKNLWDEMIVCR